MNDRELIKSKLKESLCGTGSDNVYFHKAEQGPEIGLYRKTKSFFVPLHFVTCKI